MHKSRLLSHNTRAVACMLAFRKVQSTCMSLAGALLVEQLYTHDGNVLSFCRILQLDVSCKEQTYICGFDIQGGLSSMRF